MDQLDRLFSRLVHNIRSRNPSHLSLPFTVAELYEQIVPYRHNRRELGMDTNQDYELTVLRLLSGERGYLLADAAMQDTLRRELEARDPDPGKFREFGAVEVSIAPSALEQMGTGGRPQRATPAATASSPAQALAENPPASTGAQATAAAAVPSSAEAAAPAVSDEQDPADRSRCRFCGTALPQGREVKFCPNCGQNLAISRCPACGSEIEAGWKFCITCGRAAGE